MKESVAIAKEADAKKDFLPTKRDNSIHRARNEPERQLGSLRGVIDSIRGGGGTPSVDSIATELSGMQTAKRASVLLALQRTHGNRYVQRVVTGIQAKLKVGQLGDIYEQEADRVAEQVMRMPEQKVQRHSQDEKEEEGIYLKELPGQIPKVTPNLEARINAIRGSGQPLPESVRAFFEPRFGYDFSQVRVQTDSEADTLSRALNARAFTTGQDVFFRQGEYNPGSSSGRELMAHELTHVVQQANGKFLWNFKDKQKLQILQHSNQVSINRTIFAQSQLTLRDFGQLLSPRDVSVLAFRQGGPPFELVDRGGTGPFDDAFRIGLIREILSSPNEILLIRTSMTAQSPPHDLYRNGQMIRSNITTPLYVMTHGGASGVHIPSRSLALAHPNYTGPVSRVDKSYVIYHDPNSLAHELFGHAYLSIKGSPFGHGGIVTASANIRAPDGSLYTGEVDRFISEFVSEVRPSLGTLHFSPTRVLNWPTPQGGTFSATYLEFSSRYPHAWVVEQRGQRFIRF